MPKLIAAFVACHPPCLQPTTASNCQVKTKISQKVINLLGITHFYFKVYQPTCMNQLYHEHNLRDWVAIVPRALSHFIMSCPSLTAAASLFPFFSPCPTCPQSAQFTQHAFCPLLCCLYSALCVSSVASPFHLCVLS